MSYQGVEYRLAELRRVVLCACALSCGAMWCQANAAMVTASPSGACHVTDGAFTTCPDGAVEWSDVAPQFFAGSNSYLYADQADLDPLLSTPESPVDTLMLLYDECSQTKPLS